MAENVGKTGPKMNNLENVKKSSALAQLSRDIAGHEEAIQAVKRGMESAANSAIAEAMLCGQKLNQAKELNPDGGWLSWLEQHSVVKERTAQRYMKLANRGLKIEGGEKSVQCVLALFADEPAANELPAKTFPPYLEAIGRFGKWKGYVEAQSFKDWPREGVEKLVEDLEGVLGKAREVLK